MPRRRLLTASFKKFSTVLIKMAKTKVAKAKKSTKPRAKRVKATNVPEWASISCKRTLAGDSPSNNFNIAQLYSLMNTSLDQFPRAVALAQAFQYYRIKQIAVTFKSTFDTSSAGGNASKMRMYYMIDKSGSIPTNITLEGLKQMGARPRELDEKGVVISWSPSVLEASMFAPPAVTAPAKYQISPWLTTKNVVISPGVFVPSNVDHLGLYWYCDQFLSPYRTEYQIEVEVQFEFKKPLNNELQPGPVAVPATFAVLDNSPDGTTNKDIIGNASFSPNP